MNKIKYYKAPVITSLAKSLFFIFLLGLFYSCSTITPPISSTQGMVASAHPAATQAGLGILKIGGNAVDAAVASAFVLSVVEPYASGLGGGGFLTIQLKGKEPIALDYRETAPSGVTDELYYADSIDFKHITSVTPLSVGVPGTLAALNLALNKYGSMSLEEVIKPAIKIAREGFKANETLHNIALEKYDVVSGSDELSELYLKDDLPVEEGTLIKNEKLARTYERISSKGIKLFYEGDIAASIAVKTNNRITLDDLKKYEVKIKQPVIGNYKGYKIITTAPPSGGANLIELLNILENFDLTELGHNSAEYINIFAKAIRLIQIDKSNYMGDPDYESVPVEKLTDKKYAKIAADFIAINKPNFEWEGIETNNSESGSTTSLTVVDNLGNFVSLTQSINLFFGSGIVADGVLLNNHLGNFDKTPGNKNSIVPGKRPVSSISPTILLKDGKPFLTIGTPGGSRIIGTLAQIIVNIIDFNMTLEEAIDAPRVHQTKTTLHLEGGISEDVQAALKEIGYKLSADYTRFDKYFGGAQAIMIDYETNKLIGAADKRRGGSAQGY